MSKLRLVQQLGSSIWLDYIRRSFLVTGELQTLIDDGLLGLTSNPSIFEAAIAGSQDYDADIIGQTATGKSSPQVFEAISLQDVALAAEIFRPVFTDTEGRDGYVSIEVDPTLAHDASGTIKEARRLFYSLRRRNVMIKVPATAAGVAAIASLIGEGINVNATLIFSLAQYEAVAEAYLAGLEKRYARGQSLSRVISVASVFISRLDTAVDRDLGRLGQPDLRGKAAISNARIIYDRFRDIFSGPRWERLAGAGAWLQRPLWASTSTKDPHYSDTMYADGLLAPDTVITLPPATLKSFAIRGLVRNALEQTAITEARAHLSRLFQLGIDIDAVCERLQDDGVDAFIQSFQMLQGSIETKRCQLMSGWKSETISGGSNQAAFQRALVELAESRACDRLWNHDHTLWKNDPAEITNRLGWLHAFEKMVDEVGRLEGFVEAIREDGFNQAILLGMGGSSLAPELFSKMVGPRDRPALRLDVLDTTHPQAISSHSNDLDLERTLFIVSTKSGTTVETHSLFKYFYNRAAAVTGKDRAGGHFIAITDPGSKLEIMAGEYRFRDVFLNDPNIGGRYSALSYFGLLPAALCGLNVKRLLERALSVAVGCDACIVPRDNPAMKLGAWLGELANMGRDKLTLFLSPAIVSFGDWVEQLIAESTGKEGKGILPVVGEPKGPVDLYGRDRLFVHLRLDDEAEDTGLMTSLQQANHPTVQLMLRDTYDLGGQFFLWMMATAIACYRLGVNPFDQPNVESAKVVARKMVDEYIRRGSLPRDQPALKGEDIQVFGEVRAESPEEALHALLAGAEPGAYIALQSFVPSAPETDAALQQLRLRLRDRSRLATTLGYGPRFLHSTGQLHKGDAGHGLFLQFTADHPCDIPIPDEPGRDDSSVSFGVLIDAQALGDYHALRQAGRQVLRFHLGRDVVRGLTRLVDALG